MKIIVTLQEKNQIIDYLINQSNTLIGMNSVNRANFLKKIHKFSMYEGRLFCMTAPNEFKLVIADDDSEAQLHIFNQLHLPDHTGMKAMYMKSKTLYIGFKREKLNAYVSSCLVCRRNTPLVRVAPIIPIISQHPWQLVQMDCIDLRNYSDVNDGYGWILNILDSYSKFIFPVPLVAKTAENVKNALTLQIDREGAPVIVQTDNGREFCNTVLQNYLADLNITFKRGRPRHPQNQGQVERANQTLVKKLAKALSTNPIKRWIDILSTITAKYNRTWHREINKTPMEAFRNRTGFNRPGSIAMDIEEESDLNIQNSNSDFVGILEYQESEEVIANLDIDNLNEVHSTPNLVQSIDTEYRERYILRMQQDADVHFHRLEFNPGDSVLIKKDFDTNPQTRRKKMDDFYEEGTWIIVERAESDNFKVVKDGNSSVSRFVCKNRLKKINS